jgi:hypothetical protein
MIYVFVARIVNIKNAVENNMSNKIEEEFREEILLADALLRLSVIEKLLINKGIFTKEEFLEETSKISSQITQILLEKINAPTDLNKIAEKIKSNKEN